MRVWLLRKNHDRKRNNNKKVHTHTNPLVRVDYPSQSDIEIPPPLLSPAGTKAEAQAKTPRAAAKPDHLGGPLPHAQHPHTTFLAILPS